MISPLSDGLGACGQVSGRGQRQQSIAMMGLVYLLLSLACCASKLCLPQSGTRIDASLSPAPSELACSEHLRLSSGSTSACGMPGLSKFRLLLGLSAAPLLGGWCLCMQTRSSPCKHKRLAVPPLLELACLTPHHTMPGPPSTPGLTPESHGQGLSPYEWQRGPQASTFASGYIGPEHSSRSGDPSAAAKQVQP